VSPIGDFPEQGRFEYIRRLGAGGMGVVYEAHDRELGATVALKTLRLPPSGEFVLLFKNEFRALQDIQHRNLVELYELLEQDGQWFFTMELLDGVNFVEYVRPSSAPWWPPRVSSSLLLTQPRSPRDATQPAPDPPPLTSAEVPGEPDQSSTGLEIDFTRLRHALAQLAEGLDALHRNGKVHRDIKPSNILITPERRLVLLDFGLATGIGQPGRQAGTPEYMAPEQIGDQPIGPAADWYSVGVLLYQTLCTEFPFAGSRSQIFDKKRRLTAPDVPLQGDRLPEDLRTLCRALLERDPAARPTGLDILHRLGADVGAARRRRLSEPMRFFVGREAELRTLHRALDDLRSEGGVTVLLHGQSGVGKSELMHHFGNQIKGRATVLAGRCYEPESVPYKAVDGLIDALSEYLDSLPFEELEPLLPAGAGLLAKVFPVLERIDLLRGLATTPDHADAQELRAGVFRALRELLAALARRAPLVLLIDDLQWADDDSLALLRELTRPPEAPAMLLLATVRTASDATSQQALVERLAALPGQKSLYVEPLPPRDARELANQLAQTALPGTAIDVDLVAAEARGHPLFIAELVRHRDRLRQAEPQRLDDAIWTRVSELDDVAQRVLHLLAVAGRPLPQELLRTAAEVMPDQFQAALQHLRREHLVRSAGSRRSDKIETYHDRVREAVTSALDADALRQCHERLAVALQSQPLNDLEALANHLYLAGDRAQARHFLVAAGDQARSALAFNRAIHLYRRALGDTPEDQAGPVWRSLGDALASAGHCAEAASAYQRAATGCSGEEAIELHQRAADQLMRGGYIDAGITAMIPLLDAARLTMPRTPAGAAASFLGRALRLKLTNPSLSFRPRSEAQLPREQLARIDLCWTASFGLFLVDQIRGADYHMRHLELALAAGEPFRILRGLAMEAMLVAGIGGDQKRIESLLARAEDLTRGCHRAYADGIIAMSKGAVALLQGKWRSAHELGTLAEAIFRARCTGVTREIAGVRQNLLWPLAYLGRLRNLAGEVHRTVRTALDRGDLFAAMGARSGFPNIVWLMDDAPDLAREQATMAIASWSQSGVHLQHLFDLFAQVQIDLYIGDAQRAGERIAEARPRLRRSGLLRCQLNRILFHELGARAALAQGAATPGAAESHLAAVRDHVRTLTRQRVPWAAAHAELLRAQLALLQGQDETALAALDTAHASYREADMFLHATAAQAAAGFLRGGSTGQAELDAAVDFLRREAVRLPARLIAVLLPAVDRLAGFSGAVATILERLEAAHTSPRVSSSPHPLGREPTPVPHPPQDSGLRL
jgi:serine/threonine protein kinase/tetratricopeptide (TPR) repeat protein